LKTQKNKLGVAEKPIVEQPEDELKVGDKIIFTDDKGKVTKKGEVLNIVEQPKRQPKREIGKPHWVDSILWDSLDDEKKEKLSNGCSVGNL